MKVKLTKTVLVGDSDVIPTAAGTTVTLSADQGAQFIKNGLGVEVKGGKETEQEQDALATKAAPELENKMAPDSETKRTRATK